jgi:membrane fusion protein (multidrug efflux system)
MEDSSSIETEEIDYLEEKSSNSTTGLRYKGITRPFSRPWAKWLLVAALAAIAIGTLMAFNYFAIRESTDDAQIDGHINPVASRVGGTVLQVYVLENQQVKAGTLLVQLDSKDYLVALDKAKADLAAAEAAAQGAQVQIPVTHTTTTSQINTAAGALKRAQGSQAAAQKDVAAARAKLALSQARMRQADVNYTRAIQDLDRMKQLIAKDEVSQQQYDTAFAVAESMRATRESEEAAIREAEASVGAAQARVLQAEGVVLEAEAAVSAAQTAPQQVTVTRSRAATAEAQVLLAKAAVEQAQLNVAYTSITAPVDGIVSKKNVEVGQILQPGQPILAIVPLEDVWVTANFKETQLKKMRPGQAAQVSVDAFGGRRYTGHVDSIAAATGARFSLFPPENATGNYVKVVQRVPVKILIERDEDPDHVLRPGMSVEVTVLTK